jgi:AraC-like DNA-binding protein
MAEAMRGVEGRHYRYRFKGPELLLGEFHCPLGDPMWFGPNTVGEGYHVVFPGTGVVIEQQGREPVVSTPNHAIFYDDHQVYRRRPIDERGDHCTFLIVDPRLLSEITADHEADPEETSSTFRFAGTHGPVAPRAWLLMHSVVAHATRTPDIDRLFVEEALMRVLGNTLSGTYRLLGSHASRRQESEATHRQVVEATKHRLMTGFPQNLSLSDLARSLYVSRFHLARIFRRHTGFTLHGYRDQLRLRHALERLTDPRTTLAEIAVDVGYNSHGHFTDRFRRAFGLSPSQARSRLKSAAASELAPMLRASA